MNTLDKMAEAYWNAFRDGFIRVGGDPKQYPTWQQANAPGTNAVRSETLRCLRHAIEPLREVWGQPFDEVFPDKAVKRSSARTINDDLMAEKLK